MAAKLIPLARITRDPSIQCRVTINPDRVKEYAEIIKEHGHMAPAVAFAENDIKSASTVLYLADGWHRYDAEEAAGNDSMPIEVMQGTKSDALLYAVRSMCRHGERATNADKRRSAQLLVEDPVHGEMSDQQIAKLLGVSVSLVNNVRRGEPTPKQKRARSVQAEGHTRSAPSGSPVNARQRKEDDKRPTKAAALKQIEQLVNDDIVDELDVVGLFATKEEQYRFMKKDGGLTTLRVVGKAGRETAMVPVTVRAIAPDRITLKFEGDGKVVLQEKE